MKKFLRTFALATLSVSSLVALASCGGDEKPTDAPEPDATEPATPDAAPASKTIKFYSTMGDNLQKVADKAIKSFEAKYPGWKVDHQSIGNYDKVRDKVSGDLQAGTQPDLAYAYPDHVARYMTTGKVVNMSNYINSTDKIGDTTIGYTAEEIADFVPGYYNEGKATNFADFEKYHFKAEDIITLPYVKSTEALYYNKDEMKAIGLVDENGEGRAPDTWDELWDACAKIKAKYPESTPLGYDSDANWFITMCMQKGWGYTSATKPHYLFNNEGTQGFLADLKTKFDQGLFITKTLYGSYTSNLFVNGPAEKGTVFSIGSTGGATHQDTSKFNWGVAPIPATVDSQGVKHRDNISQGPSLVMLNVKDKGNNKLKQQMTFLFIKELLEPEFQADFSIASGYMSARLSTATKPSYAKFLQDDENIVAVTAKAALAMKDDFFVSPAFNGSSTARDQVGTAFTYAVTGQKLPAKALADAVKKCGK